MSISTRIEYAALDELYLDPLNPRLGRNNTGREVSQEIVLELMKDWTLEELATSYLESGGFWVQEALLVTRENLYGYDRLVVIEGNRRLAALKLLYSAYYDEHAPKRWKDIAARREVPSTLFTQIPYISVTTRQEVEAFLGFRHVTGIKEWKPAEKAEFIAMLIDERGLTYDEVRRKIGSKTPSVRQNYITYRVLRQMEDTIEDFPADKAEDRFSVMYLALGTAGVQEYLAVNIQAQPEEAKTPVPTERQVNMQNFVTWIFGDEDKLPLFTDSRNVDEFGRILESPEAVEYLETATQPNFDFALQRANEDIPELIRLISQASDNVELSLTRIHRFTDNTKLWRPLERLFADVKQLQAIFPELSEKISKGSS